MILDELKITSDDSSYNEDHIIYLLNKYRAFVLKQKYSDIKKTVSDSNYQTVSLELIEVPTLIGDYCIEGVCLRSKDKLPVIMDVGNVVIYPLDFYNTNISLISKERMKYVGYNKYLQNVIYASVGPDNYLYFKSSNPQYLHLENVNVKGVFEDPIAVLNLTEFNSNSNIIDTIFPMEEALIPAVSELVLKELLGASYRPKDTTNNASDDLSDLAAFIAKNTKSALAKQISE
jgi:hypothetical protein